MPVAILITGLPGSGKETFANALLREFIGDILLIELNDLNHQQQISRLEKNIDTSFLIVDRRRKLCGFVGLDDHKLVHWHVDTEPDLALMRHISKYGLSAYAQTYEKNRDVILAHNAKAKGHSQRCINNSLDMSDLNVLTYVKTLISECPECGLSQSSTAVSPTFDAASCSPGHDAYLLVISGPSGAGKDTLINHLLSVRANFKKPIPYTTREIRAGERAGIDYHFISHKRFAELYAEHDFIQHFHDVKTGNHYGMRGSDIEKILRSGHIPVVQIYPDTLEQITTLNRFSVKSIFVMPNGPDELSVRLLNRDGKARPDRIEHAISNFHSSSYEQFEYLIQNSSLVEAKRCLMAIVDSFACEKKQSIPASMPSIDRFLVAPGVLLLREHSPKLNDEILLEIRRLSSLNNCSYQLIFSSGRKFFVRIPSAHKKTFTIAAEQEAINLRQVTPKLYPNVISYDRKTGVYVAEWLECRPISVESFCHTHLACLVTMLRDLHSRELFSNKYDPVACITQAIDLLCETESLPSDLIPLVVLAKRIMTMVALKQRLVPCHNDVSPFNVIDSGSEQGLLLSDWECSGNNYASWDLAKLSVELCFNQEQDKAMLSLYHERQSTQEDVSCLIALKFVIELQLALWAKRQIQIKHRPDLRKFFVNMFISRLRNCRMYMCLTDFKKSILTFLQSHDTDNPLAVINCHALSKQLKLACTTMRSPSVASPQEKREGIKITSRMALVVIKPGAFLYGKASRIKQHLVTLGFTILSERQHDMMVNDINFLYSDKDLPRHPLRFDVYDMFTSSRVLLLLISAAPKLLGLLPQLKGATDSPRAGEKSLRKLFGFDHRFNAVHISNPDRAQAEAHYFFGS